MALQLEHDYADAKKCNCIPKSSLRTRRFQSKMATPMKENEVGENSSGQLNHADKNLPKIDPTEYILRKRLPRRLPKRKNDVYVSNRTDFKAQMARCQEMLDTGVDEIHVHGLGAAVNLAVNLALQLQKCSLYTLQISVNTSTVELLDDLEPRRDDVEPGTRERSNSAVHIKISRSAETVLPK
ncbi:ribonuclease P protein subunit p20-like isoform X2 [Patiria miniata]|uniref:Ribonuclease P protein subunit p20 n=1 Tax=Patiria miniata TaxID=46514 RepID=A0A914B8Z1_PATMI|nr:ribonuclease P protein subunit p20-like isoform X2 [Patiria miniata]